MGLSFSIAGLTKFSATTKSLSGLANPTWKRAAFEESGLFMVTSLKSGFEKSTGPDGVVWDALSFPFRADKSGIIRIPGRQLLPMDKPLINHGELMGSLSFAMAGGKQVFIGYSNKKKSEIAQIMQEGRQNLVEFRIKGKRRTGVMRPPQRKNIGFAVDWARAGKKDDVETILDIFEKHLGLRLNVSFG